MSELECRTSDGCEAILLAERNEATEIIWALRPSSFIATPPAVSQNWVVPTLSRVGQP